jgi:hypothetical protein
MKTQKSLGGIGLGICSHHPTQAYWDLFRPTLAKIYLNLNLWLELAEMSWPWYRRVQSRSPRPLSSSFCDPRLPPEGLFTRFDNAPNCVLCYKITERLAPVSLSEMLPPFN